MLFSLSYECSGLRVKEIHVNNMYLMFYSSVIEVIEILCCFSYTGLICCFEGCAAGVLLLKRPLTFRQLVDHYASVENILYDSV